MAQHEGEHLRRAVADPLEIALESQVVGQIQLADARRIAAAAQVLQQDGVVQFPSLQFIEAKLLGNLQADPATAYAVALRLAFGDIKRVAEGAQQLGQTDFGNR